MSQPRFAEWERLHPKTLLTSPLRSLRSVGPTALAALIGLGSAVGMVYALLALPVALALVIGWGTIPWLTTRVRVADAQLTVRSGLLVKRSVSARLDRIRSVDLEATLVHRLLGVVRVKIGTGVDEGQIELDSLSQAEAEQLRALLLSDHRPVVEEAQAPEPAVQTLATIDWSWIRFAPLNLVHLGVVLGAGFAIGGEGVSLVRSVVGSDPADALMHASIAVVIVVGGAAALTAWVAAACAGYTIHWFNLRLTREPAKDGGTALNQRAGLLTTRSVTVEEAKVRGVRIRRQLLIAAAGGAELSLLTQGLENNTPAMLPAAPRATTESVATEILGDATPVTGPLTRHGRKAFWRHLRYGLWGSLASLVVCGVVAVLAEQWAWLLLALPLVALALVWSVASYRNLSHTLTERHLVAHSGAITRTRTVLEIDGIVGWKIHQNPFDRRLRLADLSATTAAGDEQVQIADIPLRDAIDLAAATTPQLVKPFLSSAR